VVDGVMKNKNLRMKEKLHELSKKKAISVLGGNHRLEAGASVGDVCPLDSTELKYPRASVVSVSHCKKRALKSFLFKVRVKVTNLGLVLRKSDNILQPPVKKIPGIGKVLRGIREHE